VHVRPRRCVVGRAQSLARCLAVSAGTRS
jgi:hypothetical protein